MDRFWKYKLDHAIFWVATVGFHMFTKRELIQLAGPAHFLLEALVRNGLLAALIYTNLGIFIPRFAQKGKIPLYVLLLVASLCGYVLLKNAYDVYLYGSVLSDPGESGFFDNSYYNASIALFYLAFSVALHLSKAWYFQRELIRKMKLENLNAELDYLRAQINPHFVFNSLNTIYFQIERQNEAARQALSDFSRMLRYQLYECNGKEIAIEKEIDYIKSYVAMQEMRKDENYNISLVQSDNLKGFTVCPLLLIPFVENAFKHVSHFSGRNEIRISMDRNDRNFLFSVFNTREAGQLNGEHAGIGLKNVRRRLELLYKDRHNLQVDERPGSYEIKLSLRIDDNEQVKESR